jgi:hypothetical protein
MKALTKLESLKVQGCSRIDDESIPALLAMPALRNVDLQGTSVTEKGAGRFRAVQPGAVVFIGPWDAKAGAYRNN